jgi:uncharacterized damage-inducible protein DinB
MLFKHYYSQLFRYNHWATKETIGSIKKLDSPTDRVISLISHIISAQQIWFNRIIGEKSSLSPWEVYTIEECLDRLKEITSRWLNYLEHTSDEGLEIIIQYTNTKGEVFENSVNDILKHVINHSTYHRAQIALLVKEAGGKPAVTDYIVYARSIK